MPDETKTCTAETCSCCADAPSQEQLMVRLDEVLAQYKGRPGALIPVLQQAQAIFGYLPEVVQRRISQGLAVPLRQVYGVITFYSFFSTVPRGRHLVRVCLGTACYVRGAGDVLDALKVEMGVDVGETTEDDLFTLDVGRCFGCCGLAPVVMVDDDVYPAIDPAQVGKMLDVYRTTDVRAGEGSVAVREETVGPITSVEELTALRESAVASVDKLLVCMGGGCLASGSAKVRSALDEALKEQGLTERVAVVETGCLGPCVRGPVVLTGGDNILYQGVTPDDARQIVQQHVVEGKIVESLCWTDGPDQPAVPVLTDIPFFAKQNKIVLRNCGQMDPTSLTAAIGHGAYEAMGKTLTSMSPDDVLKEMEDSGLRGRGGAGFPTWRKWLFTKQAAGETKYVLCNGDEGDPGAFMDRSVLEGDPHSVIEGMAIAAYAIGAAQGYVYVRAEYPLAVERLQIAIEAARAGGLLGQDILGTDFAFDMEIRMGSGAFVCGEETALIASIEGKRGEPRRRPPFPAVKGLWDKPSLLNNVETYANVAPIILNGGNWYASFGTEASKGTKIFALAGEIVNTGLVEVPMGTTLGELVFDIGGGVPDGKQFKAVQIGGPSGGCIPAKYLDVPLDYESLNDLGAIMGSGGLVVVADDKCMVDMARFFLEFVQEESCGSCVPCRIGTQRMLEILTRICEGKGVEGDIEELERMGGVVKDASLCGLGQTAPNPVLSTIRHFRDEYEAHIEGRCPAHQCRALIRYTVNDNCIGCTLCARACPADAIAARPRERHEIDQDKCIRCGDCLRACRSDAIDVE